MKRTCKENNGQLSESTEAAPNSYEECWIGTSEPTVIFLLKFTLCSSSSHLLKTDGQVTNAWCGIVLHNKKIHLVFFPIPGTELLKFVEFLKRWKPFLKKVSFVVLMRWFWDQHPRCMENQYGLEGWKFQPRKPLPHRDGNGARD